MWRETTFSALSSLDCRSVKYVSELGTEILFKAQRLKASWDIRNHHHDSQTSSDTFYSCDKEQILQMQKADAVTDASGISRNSECQSAL